MKLVLILFFVCILVIMGCTMIQNPALPHYYEIHVVDLESNPIARTDGKTSDCYRCRRNSRIDEG